MVFFFLFTGKKERTNRNSGSYLESSGLSSFSYTQKRKIPETFQRATVGFRFRGAVGIKKKRKVKNRKSRRTNRGGSGCGMMGGEMEVIGRIGGGGAAELHRREKGI